MHREIHVWDLGKNNNNKIISGARGLFLSVGLRLVCAPVPREGAVGFIWGFKPLEPTAPDGWLNYPNPSITTRHVEKFIHIPLLFSFFK